jgi:hypothetical protein
MTFILKDKLVGKVKKTKFFDFALSKIKVQVQWWLSIYLMPIAPRLKMIEHESTHDLIYHDIHFRGQASGQSQKN